MPRKIKLENKVKKQKQKQTQKQIVKQSVVVRLDGVQKKKRQYKRRKPREGSGGSGKEQYNMTAQPLPPNVIYQSTQYLPYESPTVSQKIPLKSEGLKTGTPSSMFEDVGVGREGLVKILEKPEPDFISLIAKPAPIESLVEETGKIPDAFIPSIKVQPIQDTLKAPYDIPLERTSNYQSMQNQLEPKVPTRLSIITQAGAQEMKKQDLKNQKKENKQMGIEDILSTKIGASEFNFIPEERKQNAIEAQQQEMSKIQSKRPIDEEGYTSGYGSAYKKQEGKKISENWARLTDELNALTGTNLTASQAKYAYKNLKAMRGFISIEKQKQKKPK